MRKLRPREVNHSSRQESDPGSQLVSKPSATPHAGRATKLEEELRGERLSDTQGSGHRQAGKTVGIPHSKSPPLAGQGRGHREPPPGRQLQRVTGGAGSCTQPGTQARVCPCPLPPAQAETLGLTPEGSHIPPRGFCPHSPTTWDPTTDIITPDGNERLSMFIPQLSLACRNLS